MQVNSCCLSFIDLGGETGS